MFLDVISRSLLLSVIVSNVEIRINWLVPQRIMANKSMFKSKSKKLAFILLLISGSFVILLGIAVLALGLAITHSDDFHDTVQIKVQVEPGIDYVQYWIGLPYIITGISVACSAVNLRRVSLTVCTITLSIICIVLSLAGLVVDGPDFAKWKDFRASQRYWERQDGYACSTKDNTCSCASQTTTRIVAGFTDCKTLMDLSSLYGVLISCFVFVLVILFATVILIVYVITTKKEKAKRSSRKSRRKMPEVIEITELQKTFEEPVANPSSTNQRYEPPSDKIQTTHRDYKEKEVDSVSQHNTRETGDVNGGMVMMDPGHFQLGDDDIY